MAGVFGHRALKAVDIGDKLVDGVQAFGFSEVDVELVFKLTNEFDHVEGVDVEGFEVELPSTFEGSMSSLSWRIALMVSMVAMPFLSS